MNAVTVFLTGLATTMGVVFFALLYLRVPLQALLTDLCGTTDRAHFWAAFTNVTLFLVPFVVALSQRPESNAGQSAAFAICSQIEYALAGFVVSVVVLGFVLSKHIDRTDWIRASKGNRAQ
jgi:uncharacterized membrane protein YciS (DUF1049 family)